MNITIAGAGYVGLVTSACLAEIGHTVICFDKDTEKNRGFLIAAGAQFLSRVFRK